MGNWYTKEDVLFKITVKVLWKCAIGIQMKKRISDNGYSILKMGNQYTKEDVLQNVFNITSEVFYE